MKVLLIAPIDKFALKDSGYGTAAHGIAAVLLRMKEEGKIEDVIFMNTARLGAEPLPTEKVDVSITLLHPHTFIRPSRGLELIQKAMDLSDRRFLYIMWETDRLPSAWAPVLTNKIFTGFLAPSYFVSELVKKATDTPVHYAPLYVNVDDIPRVNIQEKVDGEKTFTVLYIGQDTIRKGLKDALISYMRALGQESNVRLVLKYHRLSDKEVDTAEMVYHATITNAFKPKARVYSITHNLDRAQMYGLYHMSSLLLFPSRGEGFGLPIAESMAAGIPVVYTNWSSSTEVAAADGNIPLEYHLDEAVGMFHHGYEIGSQYAIPSISSCMSALREKYTEWTQGKAAYYGRVLSHRDIIIKKFGYDPVSSCIEHILNSKEGFAPPKVDEVMRNDNGLESSLSDTHRNIWSGAEVPGTTEIDAATPGTPPELEPDSDQLHEDDQLVCENGIGSENSETGL